VEQSEPKLELPTFVSRTRRRQDMALWMGSLGEQRVYTPNRREIKKPIPDKPVSKPRLFAF